MNKMEKNCILILATLFMLMITAASVNADEEDESGILDRTVNDSVTIIEEGIDESTTTDEEPNLIASNPNEEPLVIAPNPEFEEEPLIIAPGESIENNDELSESSAVNSTLIITVGITGFVVIAGALIVFKKKN